ncbi:MAG: STAS domain-containing protein [Candidatus Kapaibacterium sp.]|jgi:anti-anti-sigma factor|nr:STAS domain-containing protein [Candidatus Kapabacteria bacterium]
MKITSTMMENILLLAIEGRVDTNTAAEAEEAIITTIDNGAARLAVDFSGLDYVSSAGLRVFLLAAKKMKKTGGQMVLCGMKPIIKEVFDMSGFSALFIIVGTREEALNSLK